MCACIAIELMHESVESTVSLLFFLRWASTFFRLVEGQHLFCCLQPDLLESSFKEAASVGAQSRAAPQAFPLSVPP